MREMSEMQKKNQIEQKKKTEKNSPLPYTNDVVVDDENGQDETGLSDAGKM